MKPRSRSRNGTFLLRKHGLIPLLIVLRRLALDIGRKRHRSGRMHEVIDARHPSHLHRRPGLTALDDFPTATLGKINQRSRLEPPFDQHFPQALPEILHKQQVEQFPGRARPARHSRRHDLGVVHHNEIPGVEQRWKIRHPAMHPRVTGSIHDQQPRIMARYHRMVGHKRRVKWEIKLAE